MELLKNKPALLFLTIGAVCLSLGAYESLSAKTSKDNPKQVQDIPGKYQTISKDIKNNQKISEASTSVSNIILSSIKIDISGAVKNPGVYDLDQDSRISLALDKAGGIDNKKADNSWIARNINLATKLKDGDKIYIPSKNETYQTQNKIPQLTPSSSTQNQVLVGQTQGVLGYQTTLQPAKESPLSPQSSASNQKISINSSSKKDLDTLPGVGEITAQKIIDKRPYGSIEDLKTKKVVNKSVFEKIKDLIVL